jgi:hypothetical protein
VRDQLDGIFQDRLPAAHRIGEDVSRLPGIQPLALADWLIEDEAFAGQLALRDCLLAERRDEALQISEAARPAARELLDLVLGVLADNASYRITKDEVQRPDRVVVPVEHDDPMGTLGRLVQEDLCILEKSGDEHVLTAAVLCFPASWSLAEKFMHPLAIIHQPVATYDDNIARRVQRMFDMMRAEQPLWRSNVLLYDDPALFVPRARASRDGSPAPFVRSERQSLVKLPESGAVVFSIHTYLVRSENLTDAERRQLIP